MSALSAAILSLMAGASSGLPENDDPARLSRGAAPLPLEGVRHAARERRGGGDDDRRAPAVADGHERRLPRFLLGLEGDRVHPLGHLVLGLVQDEGGLARAVAPGEPGRAVAREARHHQHGALPLRLLAELQDGGAVVDGGIHAHGQGVPAGDFAGGEESLAHRVRDAAEDRRRKGQYQRHVRRGPRGDGLPGGLRGHRAELAGPRDRRSGRGGRVPQRRHHRRGREAGRQGCLGRRVGRECGRSREQRGEENRGEAREGRRQGLRLRFAGGGRPDGGAARGIICGGDAPR